MQLVWALLKFVETLIGIVCLVIHTLAINELEPVEHIVFYCGTYFSFTLISAYGIICILVNHSIGVTSEAIITFLSSVMFIMAAILSMYHAEMDYHLEYLSDFEEEVHPFFMNIRSQSIASLACGCVYMLHCAFTFDILFTKVPDIPDWDNENFEATQKLRLYFICPIIHEFLVRYHWFRKFWSVELRVTEAGITHVESVGAKARLKASIMTTRRSTIAHRRETARWSIAEEDSN